MNRKLGFLSLAFVTLIGVGAYPWLFGKPASPKDNPLKKIDVEKTSKLVIQYNNFTTRLEKQNGVWNILGPTPDKVDPSIPSEIIASLKEFTLGSIVSDNPARYAEFELDPAHAAQVDVFVEGQEKAVFSGFVGKMSGGYNDCYFRFAASSGPVYLANDLQQFQFRRDPASFRWKSVLGLSGDDPTHIRLVSSKKSWELSRSSATWTVPSGKTVEPAQVFGLIKNLHDLNADSFGTGAETPAALGFDSPATPYCVLTVDDKGTSTVMTVGKLAPKPFPQALVMRYVRSSNRSVVFLMQDAILTQLIDSFSKLPK